MQTSRQMSTFSPWAHAETALTCVLQPACIAHQQRSCSAACCRGSKAAYLVESDVWKAFWHRATSSGLMPAQSHISSFSMAPSHMACGARRCNDPYCLTWMSFPSSILPHDDVTQSQMLQGDRAAGCCTCKVASWAAGVPSRRPAANSAVSRAASLGSASLRAWSPAICDSRARSCRTPFAMRQHLCW